jgi:hypothetical protein
MNTNERLGQEHEARCGSQIQFLERLVSQLAEQAAYIKDNLYEPNWRDVLENTETFVSELAAQVERGLSDMEAIEKLENQLGYQPVK